MRADDQGDIRKETDWGPGVGPGLPRIIGVTWVGAANYFNEDWHVCSSLGGSDRRSYTMTRAPITIAIIGAGQRGAVSACPLLFPPPQSDLFFVQIYANYCQQHPAEAKVVAVCEPRPWRLAKVADANNVPGDMRFQDWKELFTSGKRVADAVAVTVLDGLHAEIVRIAADLGYAILCEKVRKLGIIFTK